jgi:hypothetical protein
VIEQTSRLFLADSPAATDADAKIAHDDFVSSRRGGEPREEAAVFTRIRSALCSVPVIGAVLGAVGGCESVHDQHVITGEPMLYGVEPGTGRIIDRDVFPMPPAATAGDAVESASVVVPHQGEMIAVTLSNLFIRELKELGSPHVLVYAEIHDDGTDNRETMHTRVLFEAENQPSGANLGLAGRLVYGPTPFRGYPLRIKLYVVELDKQEKELASRIIAAAGDLAGTASAASPGASLAFGLAVDIAQAINALNQDDFELRADITFHPVSPVAAGDVGDPTLDGLGEPVQRTGERVAIETPLRTGSFLLMKRELRERFSDREATQPSTLQYDWAQEHFIDRYQQAPADGRAGDRARASTNTSDDGVDIESVLRVQGGYLYRVFRRVGGQGARETRDADTAGGVGAQAGGGPTDARRSSHDGATVIATSGPNIGKPIFIEPGTRELFTDQTYALLTVVTGLQHGVEQGSMREQSRDAAARLGQLLDAGGSYSTEFAERVDAVASTAATLLETRSASRETARKVARTPALRGQPAYVLLWSRRLRPLDGLMPESVRFRNAVATNAAVLPVLHDLIADLPWIEPDDAEAGDGGSVAAVRGLTADDLEPMPGAPGVFRLTNDGRRRFDLTPRDDDPPDDDTTGDDASHDTPPNEDPSSGDISHKWPGGGGSDTPGA